MAAKRKTRTHPGGSGRSAELSRFVDEHPEGWEHRDWLGLLDRLRDQGHDTADQDAVGAELERERLSRSLARLPGVGPRRVQALATHFGTLWALRHTSADEIAAVPGVPRAVAERIAAESG